MSKAFAVSPERGSRIWRTSAPIRRYRQSGLNRGREKAYYENARQAHYERFGPRLVHSTGRAADNTPPSLEVRSRAGGWFPAS